MKTKSFESHSVYSAKFLNFYDLYVLGFSNRWAWRCPTKHLLKLYNQNISSNHLDVGVGTGWYLDKCTFPKPNPRLVLLDQNPNCLEEAAGRCARYSPEKVQGDLLKPIHLDLEPFDSIGMQYLFHCLPGTFSEKACALGHLIPYLSNEGTLFGSTIIARGAPLNYLGRQLIRIYNEKGIFGNANDSLEDVQAALAARFDSIQIELRGNVVLFSGACPIRN